MSLSQKLFSLHFSLYINSFPLGGMCSVHCREPLAVVIDHQLVELPLVGVRYRLNCPPSTEGLPSRGGLGLVFPIVVMSSGLIET